MTRNQRSYISAGLPGLLLLAQSAGVSAQDNVHITGNLLNKSCQLVVQGGLLAEVHFPTISNKDLISQGRSDKMPMVFQLENCKGPAAYSVKVTLTGTEDTEQPGFLALDPGSIAQGVGIGIEKDGADQVFINNTDGASFVLSNGNNTLNFKTWIQAKSGRNVTFGEFTATATATFEYL